MQFNIDADKANKDALAGNPEDLDASDVDPNKIDVNLVRRYEFFTYTGDDSTLNPNITDGLSFDGETHEAMCDEVDPTVDQTNPQYLHGHSSTNQVEVTNVNGDAYFIDCSKRILVGEFLGSQIKW